MARKYSRSRQAMQKLITFDQRTWAQGKTFQAYNMTDAAAGFDDECIVKRLISSISIFPTSSDDNYNTFSWQILQTQTADEPVEADMNQDNLSIAGGLFAPHSLQIYDHTITMRKLSGSAVWLVLSCPGGLRDDCVVSAYTQLHYVEN